MVDLFLINTPLKDYDLYPKVSQQTLPVLGLAYIATYAEHMGFSVELLDAEAKGIGVCEIQEIVNAAEPVWVGLNLLAPTYENSVKILGGISPTTKIMLGGHQAKATPDRILADDRIPRLDALILGEGELRVVEILQDPTSINHLPKVFSRSNAVAAHSKTILMGNVITTEIKPVVNRNLMAPDIDEMPFVNRKFLPNDPYLADDGRVEANIVGSRGCPFDCSFCGAAVSANPDVKIRMRNVGGIIGELTQLHDEFGCTAFRFVDDLFLANPGFLKRMLEAFTESDLHKKIVWDATGRINVLDKLRPGIFDKMKDTGCREVALGIESGSDRLLNYIDKKLTREQIRRTAERLLSTGIDIKGYFILGFPTETKDEFCQTLEFIHELWSLADELEGKFRCSVFEFRPYPGTPEWQRLVKNYGYCEDELLAYKHAEIEAGHKRDQFNFTSDLQFGETSVGLIRESISAIMSTQHKRSKNPRHEMSLGRSLVQKKQKRLAHGGF